MIAISRNLIVIEISRDRNYVKLFFGSLENLFSSDYCWLNVDPKYQKKNESNLWFLNRI
jgi:hypothetical protein